MKKRTVLAITLGDINGIGPEVALKTAARRWPAGTTLLLIGDTQVLRKQAELMCLPMPLCWSPDDGPMPARRVLAWNPMPERKLKWTPGRIQAAASAAAVDWIGTAVEGCMNGMFDAMITAPICKEGLKKAGLKMPGHTEFIAELTGTDRFAMMLIGDALRVVLVTRHLPLKQVAGAVTRQNILEAITIAAEALPWLSCRSESIGVCALNPHAGDGGALGDEEDRIIKPAIQTAKRRGIRVEGPVPADVIFHQAVHGRFDAVVSMYHDQGLGPLKMLAFDRGINITLGLPIIRTSPDHGTAFQIAGKGLADPRSTVEAVKLARQLTAKKNPWRRP